MGRVREFIDMYNRKYLLSDFDFNCKCSYISKSEVKMLRKGKPVSKEGLVYSNDKKLLGNEPMVSPKKDSQVSWADLQTDKQVYKGKKVAKCNARAYSLRKRHLIKTDSF